MGLDQNVYNGDIVSQTNKQGTSVQNNEMQNGSTLSQINNQGAINPNQTNYFDPNQVDNIIADRIYEQEKIDRAPGVAELTNRDFFPGRDTPVTQQGYSGKTFSAPTIAPTGGLFPYAVVNAQMAEAKLAKQKRLQNAAYETPEFAELTNLADKTWFNDLQYGFHKNLKKQSDKVSKKYHGTTAYSGEYGKQEMEQGIRMFNQIAAIDKVATPQAINIVSHAGGKDAKGFYTKTQNKEAQKYIAGHDRLEELARDPENADPAEIKKIGEDMAYSYKIMSGIHNTVREVANEAYGGENGIGKVTLTTIEDATDKAIKTGTMDASVITQVTASPFYSFDDKKGIYLDEDKVDAHYRQFYNKAYGDFVEDESVPEDEYPSYEEAKTVFKNMLDATSETSIKSFNNQWKKAEANARTNKKYNTVEVDSRPTWINLGGGQKIRTKNTWRFTPKQGSGSLSEIYNPETNQNEQISGINEYSITATHQLPDGTYVNEIAVLGGGDRLVTDEEGIAKVNEEIAKKNRGEDYDNVYYQDDKGKITSTGSVVIKLAPTRDTDAFVEEGKNPIIRKGYNVKKETTSGGDIKNTSNETETNSDPLNINKYARS